MTPGTTALPGRAEGAEGPGDLRPRGSQASVPCWFMRGGTSRGPFFRASDLPSDTADRDAVLLAAMGSPDPRQIDGLGGATPLTSKAGIVDTSSRDGVDLEFRFAQLQPDSDVVATTANCGNMLAAVVPFAVEAGLLTPTADTTVARVLTLNTGMLAEISTSTPEIDGRRCVEYAGDAGIDGVPGTASPVEITFLDTAGSVAPGLLPTGRARDTVNLPEAGDVEVTCIDNGMPLVLVPAESLGRSGYETPSQLDEDVELKTRLEDLRLRCGELMGLGDVAAENHPKMTLIAPPRHGGAVSTRCFIPHVCHTSIGVLAAVTVATSCALEGTVARDHAVRPTDPDEALAVEHPSGAVDVRLAADPEDPRRAPSAALVRTARLIMAGEVLVPRRLLDAASGGSSGGSPDIRPR